MYDPCAAGCLRGHGERCHALASGHRRYCALIAMGREDYARLVDERTANPPPPGAEKPRVPLGTKLGGG